MPPREFPSHQPREGTRDIARGFIAALEAPGIEGEVINLGTGFEISIRDVAQTISNLMDASIEIQADDARIRPELSEVHRLCADRNKASKLLRWEPLHQGMAGLEAGLKQTISWFRNPAHLKTYKSELYNI